MYAIVRLCPSASLVAIGSSIEPEAFGLLIFRSVPQQKHQRNNRHGSIHHEPKIVRIRKVLRATLRGAGSGPGSFLLANRAALMAGDPLRPPKAHRKVDSFDIRQCSIRETRLWSSLFGRHRESPGLLRERNPFDV